MVNQTILEYLKKYSSQYKVEDLKQKILSSGYSENDFDKALLILKSENVKIKKDDVNVNKYPAGYSKWLKSAGICGILILIYITLSSFLIAILPQNSLILSIILIMLFFISDVSCMFFFYGFAVLGNKYDKKLIKIISWILIILITAFALFFIILLIFPNIIGKAVFQPLMSSISLGRIETLISALGIFLFLIISAFVVLFVLGILFSIGLITLRKKVKYASITGILNIIGLCTLIIGIGFLILLVSFVFEIILLIKESRK